MKTAEKKEKPVPKRCVCGAEAIIVESRGKNMCSCPNPMNCRANLRTSWKTHKDMAIAEWNNLVGSTGK